MAMTRAIAKLARFLRKPLAEKQAAIRATFFGSGATQRRRVHRLLTGPYAPPAVLQTAEPMYFAYRPDSDIKFHLYPETHSLSEKWVYGNVENNAGDLARLYAFILNATQILAEGIEGDIAELGVYKGNSASVLVHYARTHKRRLFLFDTFEGFDQEDLVGIDGSKRVEFSDTSLFQVQQLVGDQDVCFVQGRFPQSIPEHVFSLKFCLVHIDCDLYEPAKSALEFFYPRLSPGGLIIIHDYANPYWPGIKRAVDEYTLRTVERPLVFPDKSGTAMIRKVTSSIHLTRESGTTHAWVSPGAS